MSFAEMKTHAISVVNTYIKKPNELQGCITFDKDLLNTLMHRYNIIPSPITSVEHLSVFRNTNEAWIWVIHASGGPYSDIARQCLEAAFEVTTELWWIELISAGVSLSPNNILQWVKGNGKMSAHQYVPKSSPEWLEKGGDFLLKYLGVAAEDMDKEERRRWSESIGEILSSMEPKFATTYESRRGLYSLSKEQYYAVQKALKVCEQIQALF